MTEYFDTLLAAGRALVAGEADRATLETIRAAAGRDVVPLLAEAARHGMVPIACRAIEQHAADALSAASREVVARERRLAGARALSAAAQLADALERLATSGIRAMPYKGPVLSLAAYGDAGLRSSDDIDVLIDPADVDRAWDALRAAGYRLKEEWEWKRWRAANAWQGQLALLSDRDGLTLDLHWRTCDEKLPWNVPLGELWVSAREIDLAGRAVKAPDVSCQLLLVLLHAARHGWDRLEYLVCAAALLNREMDRERMKEFEVRPGAGTAIAAGLFAVAALFGGIERLATAPGSLADTAEHTRGLAVAALRRVRTGDAGADRSARLHLQSLDGPLDRARYLTLAALQPTAIDYESNRLPDALSFAYPLVRLARLATRG